MNPSAAAAVVIAFALTALAMLMQSSPRDAAPAPLPAHAAIASRHQGAPGLAPEFAQALAARRIVAAADELPEGARTAPGADIVVHYDGQWSAVGFDGRAPALKTLAVELFDARSGELVATSTWRQPVAQAPVAAASAVDAALADALHQLQQRPQR